MPLPHMDPSEPSALNMIIRKSAFFDGAIRIRPSEPTPVWRSLTATPRAAGAGFFCGVAAELINRVRKAHPGPIRFVVGKHGGRAFYLRGIQQLISPTVMVIEESRRRSAYQIPGATIEFLMDAEECHELVALASMIGKYVRECAMKLFNDWFARHHPRELRRTAGYGPDGRRFFREIQPTLARLKIDHDSVLRLR